MIVFEAVVVRKPVIYVKFACEGGKGGYESVFINCELFTQEKQLRKLEGSVNDIPCLESDVVKRLRSPHPPAISSDRMKGYHRTVKKAT